MRGGSFQDKAIPPPSYIICGRSPVHYGGGAHNRPCPLLSRLQLSCQWLNHCTTLTANSRRFVPVPDLAIALVDATSLERPVLLSRWLPPTQNFCRGGFQRQLQPCWCKQPHLVARWCRHLRPPQRHLILPPSIPSHLTMELFIPPREGTPIHSVHKDFPHCTCRRHQPRAPNQSTGWA
jgi:hypothetical protein